MSKLYTAVVPLLAVAAFAVAPALAQAEPYWTSNGKIIKEGVVEPVATTASVTVHVLGSTAKCKLTDHETIVNPVGGGAGTDEVTSFVMAPCKAGPLICLPSETLTLVAHGLNWTSELIPSTPITDEISGMEIEVKCNSTLLATYSGELTPTVGTNSTLEFSPTSGELESGTKKMTITGNDKLKGPSGDTKIGAEEVEHEPHWYSNGTRILEGVVEPVATTGSVAVHVLGSTAKCKLTDHETIVNPVGGGAGTDEVTSFVLAGCKAGPLICLPSETLTLVAHGLNWTSELIPSTPITDEISGMEIEVKCNSTLLATYSGELTPTVATNSTLEFSPTSGELESGTKKMTITGNDKLKGPSGDTKITAEDP